MCSLDEAEALKQRYGASDDVNSAHGGAAVRAIGTASDDFVDEIRRSLEYHVATSATAESIDRIVLTGGGAQLHDLGPRLAAATRLPVEVGRGYDSLSIGKTGLSDDQLDVVGPSCAVPVGLALGALT